MLRSFARASLALVTLSLVTLSLASPTLSQQSVQDVLSSATIAPGSSIGEVLAFSGDTVITGAGSRRFSTPVDGSVRTFERVGGLWTETFAADGGNAQLLGYAVAIDGDVAAYSFGLGTASLGDDGVVVLERTAGAWAVAAILSEPGSVAESSQYGRSIAISGNRIAVAAHRRINTNPYVPEAYVYERTSSGWALTERLRPGPDPVTGFEPRAGAFATPVALDGDRLALGAGSTTVGGATYAGRVFVYEYDGTSWGAPSWIDSPPPRAGDGFGGGGLQFLGDDLAVGAPGDDVSGVRHGAVSIFRPAAQGWSWSQTLARPSFTEGRRFGWTLGGNDDYLVVGADRIKNYSGSDENEPVEVYTRASFGFWEHADRLFDPHYKYRSYFGNAVAVSGTEVAMGASLAWAHSDERGIVYVDDLTAPAPVASSVVCPGTACPCPIANDFFGGCYNSLWQSAALSGGGSTSLARDTFELVAEFVPQNVVFMTACARVQSGSTGGMPRPYGAGTLCLEGSILVLIPRMTTFTGLLAQPQGIAGDLATMFGAAGTVMAGESWMFQAIYREPTPRRICSPLGSRNDQDPMTTAGRFNVTNGVSVTFVP